MHGVRGLALFFISALLYAVPASLYAQSAYENQLSDGSLRPALSPSPVTGEDEEEEAYAFDRAAQTLAEPLAEPDPAGQDYSVETDDGAGPPAEVLTGDMDTRAADERALFALPAADRDPLLFQIENIDPVTTDRRPQRLARLEPYDPTGLRLGSFVLFPETEAGGLLTSNATNSARGGSDRAFEIRSSARLVSNWSRHALELRGSRTLSYFEDEDSENDRAHLLEVRGRLDITRRANLQGLLSHDVSQESRSAIDARSGGERPDVTNNRAALTYNQRFNRLRTQLRGSITRTDFDDVRDGDAVFVNDDRDVEERQGAFRASWEFKPTLTAFAEIEPNRRTFQASGANGLARDSTGVRYRAGIDFGSSGEMVRGEISFGWGEQDADAGALGSTSAWLIDANLVWRPTALTSLAFTARSDIDDTTSARSSFAVSRSAGLELRHAFKRHFIGTAGLTYLDRSYARSSLSEEEWRTAIGLEYFLSRELIVFSRYEHVAFDSSSPGADWHSDDVRVGIRIRR